MKDARLEIRLPQEDKALLVECAEAEDCTVTDLIQEGIQDLIRRLKMAKAKQRTILLNK